MFLVPVFTIVHLISKVSPGWKNVLSNGLRRIMSQSYSFWVVVPPPPPPLTTVGGTTTNGVAVGSATSVGATTTSVGVDGGVSVGRAASVWVFWAATVNATDVAIW